MLRIACLLGLLAVSSSASARHVELLNFGASQNPPSVPAGRGSDYLGSEMTALLTANFEGTTSARDGGLASSPRSRSAIRVPGWMRAGRRIGADLSTTMPTPAQLAYPGAGQLCGEFGRALRGCIQSLLHERLEAARLEGFDRRFGSTVR